MMMDEVSLSNYGTFGGDERIAFGTLTKFHKKYGATSMRLKKQVSFYQVQKTDTLQGIALKFGLTTEEIRRVNNLWTNDSLYLRDQLLIPLEPQNVPTNGDCEEDGPERVKKWRQSFSSHPLSDSYEDDVSLTDPDSPSSSTTPTNYNNHNPNYNNPPPHETQPGERSSSSKLLIKDHSEKSGKEFLHRIDDLIQKAKETQSHAPHSNNNYGSGESLRNGSHLVVSYSLKQLQTQEDEMFRL